MWGAVWVGQALLPILLDTDQARGLQSPVANHRRLLRGKMSETQNNKGK